MGKVAFTGDVLSLSPQKDAGAGELEFGYGGGQLGARWGGVVRGPGGAGLGVDLS
jgi:hypothetical protein